MGASRPNAMQRVLVSHLALPTHCRAAYVPESVEFQVGSERQVATRASRSNALGSRTLHFW